MVGLPGSGAGGVTNGGPGVGVSPVGPSGVGPGHMYAGVGPQDSKSIFFLSTTQQISIFTFSTTFYNFCLF